MPRKSNASTVAATTETGTPAAQSVAPSTATAEGKSKEKEPAKKAKDKEADELAIEDLTMPRTMVQRLAKGVLPPNTQVQKDAITALSKGATVFINYISSTAQTHASASNRKTINPNDVIAAMRDTEFEFMVPRLEAELAQWNAIQSGKRNDYRKKVRESTGTQKGEGGMDGSADPNEQLERETLSADARSAKRVKGEGGEILEGDTAEDRELDMADQGEDEVDEEAEEEEMEEEEEADEDSGEEAPDEMEEDPLEERPANALGNASEEDSD